MANFFQEEKEALWLETIAWDSYEFVLLHPIELLLFLGVFLVGVCLLYGLGFSANMGLLTAGVVAGSLEIGVLMHEDILHGMVEVGALFLIFIASARCRYKIAVNRYLAIRFVAMYILLTTVVAAILFQVVGVSWREGIFSALLVGFTCTPSVIRLFMPASQRLQLFDRLSGIDVAQVLLVLLVLPLVPFLAGHGIDPLDLPRIYLTGFPPVGVAFILSGGWFPETLERLKRRDRAEIALAKVGAIVCVPFIYAYLMGLPLAFGAATSGVLVSESKLGGQVVGELVSLRWFISALFLVPLGMLFDFQLLMEERQIIGGAVTGLLVVKVVVFAAVVYLLEWSQQEKMQLGMHLVPVGALSFLVFSEGHALGLRPGGWEGNGEQLFVTVTVLIFAMYAGAMALATYYRRFRTGKPSKEVPRAVGKQKRRFGLSNVFGMVETSADKSGVWKEGQVSYCSSFGEIGQMRPIVAKDQSIYLWPVKVKTGTPIEGCTLEELRGDSQFNLLIVGVWRAGIYWPDPPNSFRLQLNDQLVLSGTPGAYLKCDSFFVRF